MAEDKNTLELISSITEFNDLHEYMKDDQLDKALAIVKKNIYYSAKESIDKLVDALKYVVRYNS